MNTTLAALLAAAVLAPAFAHAEAEGAPRGGQCFQTRNMRGWKALDDHTLIVEASPHRYIRLDLKTACPAMTDGQMVRDDGPSSGVICSPLDWRLRFRNSSVTGPGTPCEVGGQHELTQAEIDALPADKLP